MTPYKCANCETITELPDVIKKFVCPVCGVLNTPRRENAGTGDEACCCLLPDSFEWLLPAGEFETPNGMLYSTADDSTMLTAKEWIATFGADPALLKAWMKKMGREGKPGFKNLSTLGGRK